MARYGPRSSAEFNMPIDRRGMLIGDGVALPVSRAMPASAFA
jgi:hypothetical protein